MTRKRSWFEAPRWGDLPVSGAYDTLGIMEDHRRLPLSTDAGSGPARGSMRNRGVLVLVCFLVTLGSLLYVGKESPAKQPEKTPKPSSRATSHQPTGPQPAGTPRADHSSPAAQQKPVRQRPQRQRPQPQKPVAGNSGQRHSQPERADRAPSSRPAREHSNGRPASTGQRERARGHSQVARQPGSRVAPHEKSAHRPDTARHHPRPEHANRGQLNRGRPSSPTRRGPTPKATKPNHFQGSGSTGKHRGNGSPFRHGRQAGPPAREHEHPRGRGEPPPEHKPQAGPKPDRGTNQPAPPREKDATHSGISQDRSPSNNKVAGESLNRQSPVRTVPHHPARPDDRPSTTVRPSTEPSYRPEGHEGAIPGHRSMDARGESPTRLAAHSSAHPPDRQKAARAVGPVSGRDEVPAATARDTGMPGGRQRPVGELAQLASWAPFESAKLMLDPSRDTRGSVIEQTQQALRSLSGGSQGHSTGTLHKGGLTQRGPPLEIPVPLSGLMIAGGVATGSVSSGDGTAPLLAVIAPCLIALLCLGRGRAFPAIFRPGTVPRLALERPG